jgi:uncharacterized protein with PQ loop repeat
MNLFGVVSQILFALCLIPQPIKTARVKHVKGVSLSMWVFQGLGFLFGLIYGLELQEMPLIAGNVFGLVISVIFCVLYFRYRRN